MKKALITLALLTSIAFGQTYTLKDLDKAILDINALKIKFLESGDDYSKVSRLGYLGAYQMSYLALQEAGLVHMWVRSNNQLMDDASWIKYGYYRFLNSEAIQDMAFNKLMAKNLYYMKNKLYSEADAYGMICAAHAFGAFGAMKRNPSMSNGWSWKTYYTMCTRTYYILRSNNVFNKDRR